MFYNGIMNDPRESWWSKFIFQVQERTLPKHRTDKPVVPASVLKCTKNPRNGTEPEYSPWILKFDPAVEPWINRRSRRGIER